MTDEDRVLAFLVRSKRSFAFWRYPEEDTVHFCMQSYGQPAVLHEIEDLNGREGFVFAPFDVSEEHPIILLNPDTFSWEDEKVRYREVAGVFPSVCRETAPGILSPEEEKDVYESRFGLFSRALAGKKFDKLVLSRKHIIRRNGTDGLYLSFLRAAKRYIYSYVYLFHSPETGTWMGSTPEILLAGQDACWKTVALAGTQPLRDGKIPAEWDEKNWREQQIVAEYIREQLGSVSISAKEEGPFPVRAGEISHLKSIFSFVLEERTALGNLLALLHPTPAVCGLPKAAAFRFIRRNEGYDRAYYSGFVGRLCPAGRTSLYVNLRCMQVKEDCYELYAGGGLLASSRMENEWEETNEKLKTMSRLLPNGGNP